MVKSPEGGGGKVGGNGEHAGDRRTHARLAVDAEVVVRDASGHAIAGRLRNLSAGGACVQLAYNDDHARVGDRVDLLIAPACHLTNWARFTSLSATVRHCGPAANQLGVQFHRARHEIPPDPPFRP